MLSSDFTCEQISESQDVVIAGMQEQVLNNDNTPILAPHKSAKRRIEPSTENSMNMKFQQKSSESFNPLDGMSSEDFKDE